MRQFVVVGESLVDVVVRSSGGTEERAGGSPLNVAVGLGRLGCSVRLYTAWGADERGRRLAEHLAAAGVRASPGTGGARTSVAIAEVGADGQASYRFDLSWDPGELPALSPEPDVLHFGSLGSLLAPGAAEVSSLVTRYAGRALVSYDPNCRPSITGSVQQTRDIVEAHVRHSDLVKASDEDAGWLYPGTPAAEVARRWLALGPGLVVLTRGALGAQAWTARHRVSVPAAAAGLLVDTVGAGDAFMAGLLWALPVCDAPGVSTLPRPDLERALAMAARVAGRTCERAGADPPRLAEL